MRSFCSGSASERTDRFSPTQCRTRQNLGLWLARFVNRVDAKFVLDFVSPPCHAAELPKCSARARNSVSGAMVYVLPTSIFGFLFVAQRAQFHIPVYQYGVILLALFSLFCYVPSWSA